jgi:ABC-type uncharacterized transport system involved in gliding motility auxiliary subunit
MNRNILSIGALVFAGAIFLAVNIIAMGLHGARIDLTENRLYTLSRGSLNIAAAVDEPIRLTLYFSERAANANPQLKSYSRRVQEVLGEYARASGGMLTLQVVDPLPFSDAEDEAVEAGIVGAPTGRGTERLYFGLVGRNATDERQVIPFLSPRGEQFLEYELTRTIYLLSNPDRKTIGVLAALPVEGMPHNPNMTQQVPPWQFIQQLRQMFDVRTIERDATEIPAEIQVLLLVHPKNLQDRTLYAIDQFVLSGGRLVVFVDPRCEADFPPGINPAQAMTLPRDSNIKPLFDAWGLELVEETVAADREAALRLAIGSQQRPEHVDHIWWLGLGRDRLNTEDAVTGGLQHVRMVSAGILRPTERATTSFDPLIQTGTDSMALNVEQVQIGADPKRLLGDFQGSGEKLTLAARISGNVKTAFPEGNPWVSDPEHPEANRQPHLSESTEPINIIVVADADMLHDRLWIEPQGMGGIVFGVRKVADNGDFVLAAVDNLTGSTDLISVRARGQFTRPFDRVEELRRDAEKRFLATEQELERKLAETEAKLRELRGQQPQHVVGGQVILTPAQQAEIERFQAERIETRRELRRVQHQLGRDIERLGTRLKVINIGLMPVAVGIAAVGLSMVRISRRRQDRIRTGPRS